MRELLACAELLGRFQVADLAAICKQRLLKDLSVDNLAPVFMVADNCSMEDVKVCNWPSLLLSRDTARRRAAARFTLRGTS